MPVTDRKRGYLTAVAKGLRAVMRASRRLTIGLVVVAMLAFNVLSFGFDVIGTVFETAARGLFGRSWVADMSLEVDELRRDRSRLEVEKARLSEERRRLALHRNKLESENRRLKGRIAVEADEIAHARALRNKFDELGRRISLRTARGAARNISSMALESVPLVGAATVIAVTASEIRDACSTFNEMQELRKAAGFDPLDNLMADSCDYVPFASVELKLNEISIEECRAQADKLAGIDRRAADGLNAVCDCIEKRPGHEAVCLAEEKNGVTEPVIDRPSPG